MNLLLDTQVVIWCDQESKRLGRSARKAIESASNVFVSAASEWELAIKLSTGRVISKRNIEQAALAAGFELLPVEFRHAQAVRVLPAIHRDPFDRILVAVALVEQMTLVTSDPLLQKYPVALLNAEH